MSFLEKEDSQGLFCWEKMKDKEFVTSSIERGMLVIEAERLLYGDDRPKLRNTSITTRLNNQALIPELARANERIVGRMIEHKNRRYAQVGSGVDYKVVFEVIDAKTTVMVTAPNDSGQRDARIAHYSEKTIGGIDTQVLEVVTLKPDGQLSISTEITSTGFDGAVNWKTSFPGENDNELTQGDIKRARNLVMKATNLSNTAISQSNQSTKGGE